MKGKPNVVQTWNKFSNLMVRTAKAWEEHREVWTLTPKTDIEKLPVKLQRFLARNFNRSKFDIMLPRMVDYWRTIGGVGTLIVGMSAEEIMKELKKEKK